MDYKIFSPIQLVDQFFNVKETNKNKKFEYISGIEGTLFEDDSQLLKLNKLDDFLSKEEKMPGINSPFIYVGEAGSAFAMHIEDKALFSINFLHTGATSYGLCK